MGYRIVYGQAGDKYLKPKRSSVRLRALVSLWLLVFSVIVKTWWPAGTEKLQEILMPAALTPAQAAVETLITDLRYGTPVPDALTAFCLDLMEDDRTN